MLRSHAELLLLPLLAGCAFTPGDPWGHLELELVATFAPDAERLTEEGWLKTSTSYAIEIDALTVRVDAVTVAMQGSGGTTDFDPADPPPGYSLCHSGHCHAEDGSLPTYDEVALAASGGTGGAQTVLAATEAAVVADPDGAPVPLGACPADCNLAPGQLHAVRATLLEVGLQGRIHDRLDGDARRLPEGGVAVAATWPATLTWSAPLAGAVGDGAPIAVNVDASLELPERLFDGVDWALHLTDGGVFDVAGLAEAIVANLEDHGGLVATLTRTPGEGATGAEPYEEPVAEGPAAEACEHMAGGPFAAIAAAATLDGAAPDATIPHTRVGVSFVEVDGGFGGFVAFAASEAADYSFFLSADLPFAVLDASGSEVPLEDSSAVDACDAVAVQHVVELEVGLHHLSFGPTDAPAEVGLVFEAGAHEDHDE